MGKLKKAIVLLLILSNSAIMFGCWNYREVEELGIVAGMAIDRDKERNKFLLAVELLSIRNVGREQSRTSEIVTFEGDTIFSAIRGFIQKTGKRLFWSHARVVIINKDIAEEGIVPEMDWFLRDSELRYNTWVFISRDSTAREILMSKDKPDTIISYNLDRIMSMRDISNKYAAQYIWKLQSDLAAKGRTATAALVTARSDKSQEQGPYIGGCAIFKKDKLVGMLSENETQYFLLTTGKGKKGLLEIEKVGGTNTKVTLEQFEGKSTITPAITKDKISMNIDIKLTVAIDEVEGTFDVISDKGRGVLKAQVEEVIRENVKRLILKLQREYRSDIFGFGENIRRKDKSTWKKLYSEKKDKYFEELGSSVSVELKIKGSGRSTKPLTIGE